MNEFKYDDKITDSISTVYTGIINDLGEDPSREGLVQTPTRVAKAMQF